MATKNHGGPRKGAGAVRTHGARVMISGFWVEPSVAAKLTRVLAKLDMSSTDFFSRCIVEASEKVK